MTPIEQMKASAEKSNAAMKRRTGSGEYRKSQPTRNGKTKTVARRHDQIRKMRGHMTPKEIARRLRASVWTINADLRAIEAEDAND